MTGDHKKKEEASGYFPTRKKWTYGLPKELAAEAAYPKNALVELTNGCNHACLFCKNADQNRKAGTLSLDKFTSFVSQAAALGLEEMGLYTTGEPFLTKNLDLYVKVAKDAGLRRVYVTTNGALATVDRVRKCYESGLDSIKFSINASNAADYKLVHGVDDFQKVIRNLDEIFAWKTSSGASLQLLCSCVMIPAVGDIKEEHRKVFGKYFEDMQYIHANSQGGQAFDLVDELGVSPHGVFSDLAKEAKASDVKPCSMLWNRYHLTAEGYLTACCVDYELNLVFADLADQSVADAWNNTVMRKLRTAHIDNDMGGLLCHQCLYNKKAPYSSVMDVQKSQKSAASRAKEKEELRERIASANPDRE